MKILMLFLSRFISRSYNNFCWHKWQLMQQDKAVTWHPKNKVYTNHYYCLKCNKTKSTTTTKKH